MDFGISTGLPQLPTGSDKEVALVRPLYLAMNNLAQQVSIASGKVQYSQAELAARNQFADLFPQNHRRVFVLAELASLGFGLLVNLYLSSGKVCARLADQSLSRRAHGVVGNPNGISVGQFGEIIFVEGYTAGIAGTVFGDPYYLGNAGVVQNVPGGTLSQVVGIGLGSAGFYLNI